LRRAEPGWAVHRLFGTFVQTRPGEALRDFGWCLTHFCSDSESGGTCKTDQPVGWLDGLGFDVERASKLTRKCLTSTTRQTRILGTCATIRINKCDSLRLKPARYRPTRRDTRARE
jgi:hypothetical protein